MAPEHSAPLGAWARAALLLIFGAVTAGLIPIISGGGRVARTDALLLASSFAAFLISILWIALLALRRSRGWAIAMWVGMWLPYINLLIAGEYSRRYWRQDAGGPTLLVIAATLAQVVASARALFAARGPSL